MADNSYTTADSSAPTDQMIQQALRSNKGLRSLAAKMLGVSLGLINARIDASGMLQDFLDQLKQEEKDWAYMKLLDSVRQGNSDSISLYLKSFAPDRMAPLPADLESLFDHVDLEEIEPDDEEGSEDDAAGEIDGDVLAALGIGPGGANDLETLMAALRGGAAPGSAAAAAPAAKSSPPKSSIAGSAKKAAGKRM